MEIANIWNADVVDQNGNIKALKTMVYYLEEALFVTFWKICDNELCLNLGILFDVLNFSQSCLHLASIASYHADVEA